MPDYGVTPEGFFRKPVVAIKADIEAIQLAEISTNLDLSSATPWGQNNGIFANELGKAWEELEILNGAADPNKATGELLIALATLTGTAIEPANYSRVTLACSLTEGTTLISGVTFAAVLGEPDNLWTPLETFVAPINGFHQVPFRAANTGPIEALAGTITVINTTTEGWTSVNNSTDADPGQEVDGDAELRERREVDLATAGSATTDAVEANVIEVEGVESVFCFENDSDVTDENGLPPHSIECVVYDGETPGADDDEIAQAIYEGRAGGIQTFGAENGTATKRNASEIQINFSRAEVLLMHATLALEVGDDYAGADAVKEYWVSEARKILSLGKTVRVRQLDSLVIFRSQTIDGVVTESGVRGVLDVVSFFIEQDDGTPDNTANIVLTSRQIASVSTSRVTVTVP